MNTKRTVCTMLGALLMLGASGAAWSVCAPTSITGATSTLEQSGQGNLSCGDLASDGIAMSLLKQPPSPQAEVTVTTNGDGSIDWAIISPPDEDADAVIVEAADGKRCIYFYPGKSDFAGGGLTTANGKAVKNVDVCGNGEASEPAAGLSFKKLFDDFIDNDSSLNVSLGDRLNYTLTVSNIGTSNLTGVSISDSIATPSSCSIGSLSPGSSASCAVTYDVTLQDVLAGSVVNTATASSDQTAAVSDSEMVFVVPPAPISNVDGKCAADGRAAGLQDGVNNAANDVAVVIGIGTDEEDGNPVVAVCADGGEQVQCAKQCRPPAGFPLTVGPNSPACTAALAGGPGPNGELPLDCRVCELSSVLPPSHPPGLPPGSNYCWELSHQVDEVNGTFISPKFAEETVARARRIVGSACYEITLNFYGVEYTYYSPTGCPGSN